MGVSRVEKRAAPVRSTTNSDEGWPIAPPLLVSRKDAARMLGGVDVSTVRRLEKAGILVPKRLNRRSPTAQVFYAYENVVAAAQGEGGR